MKQKTLLISLATLFLFAISFHFVFAGTATVSWNANTEPDLSGYMVYYGTSQRTGTDPKTCNLCGYSTSVDVQNVTTYALSNLTSGRNYYFSVSAYDTSKNKSLFSSEVCKFVGYVNSDFASLAPNWLQSGTGLAGDVDNNGTVNGQDLGIMMSKWGNKDCS